MIGFLPQEPEVLGHTIIAPKHHYVDLYDFSREILCETFEFSRELAIYFREAIGATGVNLMHASGQDAQQSVLHFHVHMLPGFKNDGLDTWPQLPEFEIDNDESLARLGKS